MFFTSKYFYARSHKSKRAVVKRPAKRGSNYALTFMCAECKQKSND